MIKLTFSIETFWTLDTRFVSLEALMDQPWLAVKVCDLGNRGKIFLQNLKKLFQKFQIDRMKVLPELETGVFKGFYPFSSEGREKSFFQLNSSSFFPLGSS